MTEVKGIHNPATVVVESLLCQLETVGVCAVLDNTKVVEVTLRWASHQSDLSTWEEFPLPGGETWLKDLYTAIGEMLYQIEYRQQKTIE